MSKDFVVLNEKEQMLLERIRIDRDKGEAMDFLQRILSQIEPEKDDKNEEES